METAFDREKQGLPQPGWSPPGMGPDGARLAFESFLGEFGALDPAELITVRIDAQRAAALAYGVAVRDRAPARRATFERLAATRLYDLEVLDRLPDVALGAWYARQQQQAGRAEAPGANVPEAEVRLAYAVRGRMQQVLEYWFGDDPQLVPRLKLVREGSGYRDLANDLQILAELYGRDELREVLEADRKRYRAADGDEAKRLAGVIFASFGVREAGGRRWTDLYRRAATLLLRFYDEHRVAGRFAFRKREDVAATYPSLFTALRKAPSKRTPAGGAGDGTPGETAGAGV